ncbi:MAG: hypothetical protein ABJF23_10635 [Bryobacteraceae bacterium]
MIKKAIFAFATFAIAVASAASSYRLTVFEPSVLNGTELKPGEYKLEVKDNTAVITRGKQVIEAPVKIETVPAKFGATSVRYTNGNGKQSVDEIRLGGTNTKLVFNSTVSMAR